MEITEKKVITIEKAEINFAEFWEALQNLCDDYFLGRYAETVEPAKEALKRLQDEKEITAKRAEEVFTNWFCWDALYGAVVRYIAKANGYTVHNYGYYDKFLKVVVCSFERNGAHI